MDRHGRLETLLSPLPARVSVRPGATTVVEPVGVRKENLGRDRPVVTLLPTDKLRVTSMSTQVRSHVTYENTTGASVR